MVGSATRILALALVALAAIGVGEARAAIGDPLRPDLVTLQFNEAYIDGPEGEELLRFSNTVGNRGAGVLEMLSRPEDATRCADPGDRPTFQRIYEDSATPESDGYFWRDDDTERQRRFAGCSMFHPEHFHWHFEDFTRYTLRSEATGAIVSQATKVSFCIVDNGRAFMDIPGYPEFQYYGDCDTPESVTGLSIGWSDTYDADLAGQHLDIAGLPRGNYCLISRADPSNRLAEINEGNNARRARYWLNVNRRQTDPLDGRCQI